MSDKSRRCIQKARAIRKAKAKIQVAIGHPTAPAIIQATATLQVITHPVVRHTACPIAVRIHSHRTPIPRIHTTHPNPTEADQATLDRNRQANRHMEVPVVVATALGFGRVAGNYSIQIVKVLNHPRAPAASTARSWRWLHDPLPSPHAG